jgi:hypothetical protein
LQETITVTDAPDGPRSIPQVRTVPRPRAAACDSTPVGGSIRPPSKIKDVRPTYPTGTAAGHVSLEALISPEGFTTSVQTVGEADPALAQAAATAVSQWEFTPTLLDCMPIEVRMKVSVNFVAAK